MNALHGLDMVAPFTLLPGRTPPRARMRQEAGHPIWSVTADMLGEGQRDSLLLTLYTSLRRNDCETYAGFR